MNLALVSLLIPAGVVVLTLLLMLLFRYWRHVERMEMLRRGFAPEAQAGARPALSEIEPRLRIYVGALLTAVGLAMTLVLGLFQGPGVHLVAGIAPLFVGLAVLLVHVMLSPR